MNRAKEEKEEVREKDRAESVRVDIMVREEEY